MSVESPPFTCPTHGKSFSLIEWSRDPFALWSHVHFHCGCGFFNTSAPENKDDDHRDAP